jgi:hypothetical protein
MYNEIDNFLIVVSRYNENLDWLSPLHPNNVLVFNKGDDNIQTKFKTIKLKNVGRESHTYLSYIIENYNNLPEIILFTQGNYDHLLSQGLMIKEHSTGKLLFNFNQILNIKDSSSNFIYSKINIGLPDGRLKEWNNQKLEPVVYNNKELNIHEWSRIFLNYFYPHIFVCYGACFSVRKARILSRTIDFYKNLLKQLEVSSSPEVGHFFERTWSAIFNLNQTDFLLSTMLYNPQSILKIAS